MLFNLLQNQIMKLGYMTIKRIIGFLCLLAFSQLSFAQWKGASATIPTPNASSLGLYSEIPISAFTGVPGISVPVHSIAGNKIDLL